MGNILVVEDSAEYQRLVRVALGGQVLTVRPTLAEGRKALDEQRFDLVLLDVHLPDGNGMTLCQEMLADPRLKTIPVVFLTARDGTSDKVAGLSLGAEDYVTKPFDPVELKARVELRLRKTQERKSTEEVYQNGKLLFRLPFQQVACLSPEGERQIDLTALEFKLLLYLAKHEDHVLSREQLLGAIWGDNIHVLDRTIDSHMSNLRRKLKGTGFSIKSVYGSGYRFASTSQNDETSGAAASGKAA